MFKIKARDQMVTYAYGHDFGNAEIAGAVLKGKGSPQKIAIPSVWAPGTWDEIESLAGSMGQDMRTYMQSNHYHLRYVAKDGSVIDEYIGQKVFDDRMSVTSSLGDMERYWRNHWSLAALMVASGSLILDQTYALHLTTGVPVKHFSEQMRDKVIEALKGRYTFTLNNTERTMIVKSVRVVSEAAGALVAFGENKGKDEGLIDIGGYTTDLYGVRSQRPIGSMRNAVTKGVSHAIDLFNRKFKAEYGVELVPNTCRQIFREYAIRKLTTTVRDLTKKAVPTRDVGRLINESVQVIGDEIAGFIQSAWSNNPDIERALLVGGGAYYFKDLISERFPYVTVPADPEYANVLGYVTLSAQTLMKLDPGANEEVAG